MEYLLDVVGVLLTNEYSFFSKGNKMTKTNILKSIMATALIAGLSLSFNACTSESPLSSSDQSLTEVAATDVDGLKILKLFSKRSLHKIVTVSEYVTVLVSCQVNIIGYSS
jgi:hypothetical protein